LTSGKADAPFLKQFRFRESATRRKLATDHPNEPEVGSNEALLSQLADVFQDLQFLIGRIGKVSARYSSISCQQARLNCAL
jgi:hypothetical protein